MSANVYVRNTRTGKCAPLAEAAAFMKENPDGRFLWFDAESGERVAAPENAELPEHESAEVPDAPAPVEPTPIRNLRQRAAEE